MLLQRFDSCESRRQLPPTAAVASTCCIAAVETAAALNEPRDSIFVYIANSCIALLPVVIYRGFIEASVENCLILLAG